jgi:hypothetical protein
MDCFAPEYKNIFAFFFIMVLATSDTNTRLRPMNSNNYKSMMSYHSSVSLYVITIRFERYEKTKFNSYVLQLSL